MHKRAKVQEKVSISTEVMEKWTRRRKQVKDTKSISEAIEKDSRDQQIESINVQGII